MNIKRGHHTSLKEDNLIDQILNKNKTQSEENVFSQIKNALISVYSMGESLVNEDRIDNIANDISIFIIDDINEAVSEAKEAVSFVGNSVFNMTKTIAFETKEGFYYVIDGTYTSAMNVFNNVINYIRKFFLYAGGLLILIFIIICLIDIFKYGIENFLSS